MLKVSNCLEIVRCWLPRRCAACDVAIAEGDFCTGCAAALPWRGVCCPRCAGPSVTGAACGRCQTDPPPMTRTVAAFDYRFPMDRLVQRLKYRERLELAPVLARCLAARLATLDEPLPEALVPVPLHRARLAQRGFNQSAEIARGLGRRFGLPVPARLLGRHRDTAAQATLAPAQRAANVRRAFRARAPCAFTHVVLVDDVMTSGHTLRAAAGALAAAGCVRIDAWVVARA